MTDFRGTSASLFGGTATWASLFLEEANREDDLTEEGLTNGAEVEADEELGRNPDFLLEESEASAATLVVKQEYKESDFTSAAAQNRDRFCTNTLFLLNSWEHLPLKVLEEATVEVIQKLKMHGFKVYYTTGWGLTGSGLFPKISRRVLVIGLRSVMITPGVFSAEEEGNIISKVWSVFHKFNLADNYKGMCIPWEERCVDITETSVLSFHLMDFRVEWIISVDTILGPQAVVVDPDTKAVVNWTKYHCHVLPTAIECWICYHQKVVLSYTGQLILPMGSLEGLLKSRKVTYYPLPDDSEAGVKLFENDFVMASKITTLDDDWTGRVVNRASLLKLDSTNRVRAAKVEPSMQDVTTASNYIQGKVDIPTISLNFVSSYFRARHDLALQSVFDMLSLPFSNEKPLVLSFPDLKGTRWGAMTPDICVEWNSLDLGTRKTLKDNAVKMGFLDPSVRPTHLIIEVGVSSRRVDMENTKIMKYRPITNDINARSNGKYAIIFIPVVFCMITDTITNSEIFTGLQVDYMLDEQTRLREVHSNLIQKPEFVKAMGETFTKLDQDLTFADIDELIADVRFPDVSSALGFTSKDDPEYIRYMEEMLHFSMSPEDVLRRVQSDRALMRDMLDQLSTGNDGILKPDEVRSFMGTAKQIIGVITNEEMVEACHKRRVELGLVSSEYKRSRLKIDKLIKTPVYSHVVHSFSGPEMYTESGCLMAELLRGLPEKDYKSMPDGTIKIRGRAQSKPEWSQKNSMTVDEALAEEESREKIASRPGQGLDKEVVVRVQAHLNWCSSSPPEAVPLPGMMEQLSKVNKLVCSEDKDILSAVMKCTNSNIYRQAFFMQSLTEELMYLAGRRSYDKNNRENSWGAFKIHWFGILEVQSGPHWTPDKQIFYRIHSTSETEQASIDENLAYMAKVTGVEVSTGTNTSGLCQATVTPWLAMSYADAKHYVKVFDTILLTHTFLVATHVQSTHCQLSSLNLLDPLFTTPLLQCLEHKRGTSTTQQYNRYISHSFLSQYSDILGIVEGIGKDPIRSDLEAYVTDRQLSYIEDNAPNRSSLVVSLMKRVLVEDIESNYDRVMVPSIFGVEIKSIEYQFVMAERYYGNLFNKDSGFKGHRVKAIFKKMWEVHLEWEKIASTNHRKLLGIILDSERAAFLAGKKEPFMFCRESVYIGAREVWETVGHQVTPAAILKALNEKVTALCTTKSSVDGITEESSTTTKQTEGEIRKMAYETQRIKFQETKATTLIEHLMLCPSIGIYFGTYPKPQIGGPREILIMCGDSRVKVRLSENIARVICTQVPEEMLTKGDDKFLRQAAADSILHASIPANRYRAKIMASHNTDKEKWAPTWNMLQSIYMKRAFGYGEKLKNLLISVDLAFLNKTVMVNPTLMKKWEDLNRQEMDPIMESLRQKTLETGGKLKIPSGFEQGIKHYDSSVYHTCCIYYLKLMLHTISSSTDHMMSMFTLVSSDDKTTKVLLAFNPPVDGNFNVSKFFEVYMLVTYWVDRLFNLRTNFKKSGLSFIETEFNSMFMIGKRTLPAQIKDVYTALEIVDMTVPREAVSSLISAESRLMEGGVCEIVIKLARVLNSLFLKKAYAFSKDTIMDVMVMLGIDDENDIPYQLGFLPVGNELESYIVGPDLYMMKGYDKGMLSRFYDRLYSGDLSVSAARARTRLGDRAVLMGERYMQLPIKHDKGLVAMVDRWVYDRSALEVEVEENFYSLFQQERTFPVMEVYLNQLLVGLTSSYELSETIAMHSLLRALSMTTGNVRFFGFSKSADTMTATELEDTVMKTSEFGRLNLQEDTNVKITGTWVEFVKMVLDSNPVVNMKNHPHTAHMLGLCKLSDEFRAKLPQMTLNSQLYPHLKMRTVTMGPSNSLPVASARLMVSFLQGNPLMSTPATRRTLDMIVESRSLGRVRNFEDFSSKLFPNSRTKRQDAYRFLESYEKMNRLRRRTMVMEGPDMSSALSNLETMLRYRSSVKGVYTDGTMTPALATKVQAGLGAAMMVSETMNQLYNNFMWVAQESIRNMGNAETHSLSQVKKGSTSAGLFMSFMMGMVIAAGNLEAKGKAALHEIMSHSALYVPIRKHMGPNLGLDSETTHYACMSRTVVAVNTEASLPGSVLVVVYTKDPTLDLREFNLCKALLHQEFLDKHVTPGVIAPRLARSNLRSRRLSMASMAVTLVHCPNMIISLPTLDARGRSISVRAVMDLDGKGTFTLNMTACRMLCSLKHASTAVCPVQDPTVRETEQQTLMRLLTSTEDMSEDDVFKMMEGLAEFGALSQLSAASNHCTPTNDLLQSLVRKKDNAQHTDHDLSEKSLFAQATKLNISCSMMETHTTSESDIGMILRGELGKITDLTQTDEEAAAEVLNGGLFTALSNIWDQMRAAAGEGDEEEMEYFMRESEEDKKASVSSRLVQGGPSSLVVGEDMASGEQPVQQEGGEPVYSMVANLLRKKVGKMTMVDSYILSSGANLEDLRRSYSRPAAIHELVNYVFSKHLKDFVVVPDLMNNRYKLLKKVTSQMVTREKTHHTADDIRLMASYALYTELLAHAYSKIEATEHRLQLVSEVWEEFPGLSTKDDVEPPLEEDALARRISCMKKVACLKILRTMASWGYKTDFGKLMDKSVVRLQVSQTADSSPIIYTSSRVKKIQEEGWQVEGR